MGLGSRDSSLTSAWIRLTVGFLPADIDWLGRVGGEWRVCGVTLNEGGREGGVEVLIVFGVIG